MNQDEWARCEEPDALLYYHRVKGEKRRLRLLAVACVRRVVTGVSSLLSDHPLEAILATVEAYADGGPRSEFLTARKAARRLIRASNGSFPIAGLLRVIERLTDDAMEGLTAAICNVRQIADGADPRLTSTECQLNRDIFNPYASATFAPTWRTETVLRLAQAAYDQRALPSGEMERDRLLVLSDALEEVGAEADLLAHLRSPEPHVRGCWVLDGVLGK